MAAAGVRACSSINPPSLPASHTPSLALSTPPSMVTRFWLLPHTGLGKTTLAHVVARHCGYRPLEINASDDRSGAALTARILDAVEMRSMMGEKRPNCVIIDEIDGAAGAARAYSATCNAALGSSTSVGTACSMQPAGKAH